ncbi:MAG: hypothetical protein NT136_03235 [Candidatus Moranbacteria bacterium]|nr:hypothetical protein [Candidatus Moranbacteria bacterium]
MDFYTGKTKQYADLVFDFSRDRIDSHKDEDKELAEVLGNVLFDRDGPKALTQKKLSREDEFAMKLFRLFSEIANSYEALQNIPIYIDVFPFQKKGISKYVYFKYHIENYLNEIYILQQRMLAYLTIIERAYKKSKIKSKVSSATKKLGTLVTSAFSGYIKVRGSHVHFTRYTDEDIDRLSMIDTLARSKDEQFVEKLELLYRLVYKDIRRKWKKKIVEDKKSINRLNEIYFGTLYKTITDKGALVYPWDK